MRAISITCRQAFRYDPRSPNRLDSLRADHPDFCNGVPSEPDFRRGTIDVYLGDGPEGSRYAKLWNPRTDKLNGDASMVTYIPLESVANWEPLTPVMEAKLYPEAQRSKPTNTETVTRGHARPLA